MKKINSEGLFAVRTGKKEGRQLLIKHNDTKQAKAGREGGRKEDRTQITDKKKN